MLQEVFEKIYNGEPNEDVFTAQGKYQYPRTIKEALKKFKWLLKE